MTKELYIVSRDVNFGTTLGKHTGYMLVEKDDLGNITNVQTVDLKGGIISDIGFEYSNNNQGNFYLPDGSVVPGKVYVGDEWKDTNPQWAADNNYKSVLIGDLTNAEEAFNKIKQNAEVIDKLRDNGFPIDYMPFDQNCNTWSKYVADLYLNGFDIFDLLNDGVTPPDNYIGSEDSFPYLPLGSDAIACNLLSEILKALEENGLSINDVMLEIERSLFSIKFSLKSDVFSYESRFEYYSLYRSLPINILKENKETAEVTPSPLIVDLDGDGVETTGTQSGTHFDHDGNGFAENTGWVGKDDGILVRDINGNGEIDNGTELFGNNSVLSNGEKAANGFEALKDLDSNNDGVFNNSDAAWNEVKVSPDIIIPNTILRYNDVCNNFGEKAA